MPSKPSSHASTSSQSQQPVWSPPRAPLPPHRLAKLANALGVAAPLPATGSSHSFASQSAVSPAPHPPSPHADIVWRAGTPSVASAHNFAPSQSKYLLHVIPPAYLPHDSDVGESSDLVPLPPGASGYHTQFRRGILVSLQSTLQAQLIVIAREYALPSTLGIVLYLVCSSPQDRQNGAADIGEPGPRLSEDMWKHIWARVLRAERDDASTFSRSPTPNPLGLGLTVETNAQLQALRPLVTPTRTEIPLPLPFANLLTPSPTSASSASDLRSQTKSAPPSTSQADPDTPDTSHSSNQDLPGIELPGLKSPSIIPILAKVEFDIDRRRAGWYEPWLRSRRIAHAKRTESRSSNRTGSQSRNGDETSPADDRRAPFDLKLVGRMQKPGFLRTTDESDEDQVDDGGYAPLSGSPDGGDDEHLVDETACMTSVKDPLIDVFGTDAETWAGIHSNSQGTRKEVDPNVVELALDASSLAPLPPLADERETGDEPNDAVEVQEIMHHMSGLPLPSPPTSGSKRPPPLVFTPNLPKGVVPDNHDLPSGRSSANLPYVTSSTTPLTAEDSDFRDKEGLSLELEQEYLRSRSPAEDKRVGALFEGLDLGLDLDDEEYDENDPNDRRRSQYLMKARLDEIERTLAQFSPRQLRTSTVDEDLTITHRRTLTNTLSPDAFGSKSHSPAHDRSQSNSMSHANGTAWPAVPYSSVATSGRSSSRRSDLPQSPPKLALNGVTTGAPKAFVPPPAKGGVSSETETRRRELEQSVYPATVPAPFTRQTDLTSDSPIPLSPDPFGRYPSMYEEHAHPVSTYWDPATKQFTEIPADSRPSTSSVDEGSLASTTQSSRFSADSSIAADLADKGGKTQGALVSVKSLKKLWRRSKGSSVSTAQPPTPSPVMSFQGQLSRPPQEQLGPPPVTTAAVRNGKAKAPMDQFQFDQESPYPIHPGRPSLNGTRPISPPVPPPPIASGEKMSVRKSILKSWKSVTGSQQNPSASDTRKSAERPVSNETVKPRRPSVLDNSVPPSPKLPGHLLQSNHAQNGSGVFERRKSAGRSKMSSKANYSSSSQDMLGITSQSQRSSIVMMQAPGSASPSRSQFSASSMDSNTEGRGSFDTTSQFEVISAPKVHPNLAYPYQTLDYEQY